MNQNFERKKPKKSSSANFLAPRENQNETKNTICLAENAPIAAVAEMMNMFSTAKKNWPKKSKTKEGNSGGEI